MAGNNSGRKSGKPADYRSAKTGEYVTRSYADKHPSTIVRETRKSK